MRLGLGATISKKAIKRKPRSLPTNQSTKSLYFDGTDDYGDMAYSSDHDTLRNGDFTVAFWINLEQIGAYQFVLNNWASFNNGWSIRVDNTNKLRCAWNGSGHLTNFTLAKDTWYHLAYTCDRDGNGTWYKDGSATNSASVASISVPSSTAKFRFGASSHSSGTFRLNGYLDEFGIWSDVLSADAVAEIYGSGKPPFRLSSNSGNYTNSAKLLNYFVMGDHQSDDNTVMNDEGSIGNNIALSNMVSGNLSTEVPS